MTRPEWWDWLLLEPLRLRLQDGLQFQAIPLTAAQDGTGRFLLTFELR